MNLRDENSHDWTAVYQVITSAFGRSAEAKLVGELRGAGDSVISLVAEEDGQVVGHVLLSRMDAPFPALALAPYRSSPEDSGVVSDRL
jgi:putative acetyltransferase